MNLKTISLAAGALTAALALAAPAAAQGRATVQSANPPSTATTASQGRGNPPTTTAPMQKPATTPKPTTPLTVPPNVVSKVQPLLPAGTDIATASNGFKNVGQFIAAVHVSNNLSIPFDQLKTKMTSTPAESLGQAIHNLKPDANSANEVKKAQKQAKADQSGKS